LQRQRSNTPADRGRRIAATAQHDDTLEQAQFPPSFTADQYNKLIALLNKHDLETSTPTARETTGTAMMAGKILCFSASKPNLKWIIDSGATDHITPNLLCFSSYTPIGPNSFINMPTGQQARIHHVGTVQLTPSLTLHNVLHVPAFQYNLLSASRLAKQLTAHVVFTPTACYL